MTTPDISKVVEELGKEFEAVFLPHQSQKAWKAWLLQALTETYELAHKEAADVYSKAMGISKQVGISQERERILEMLPDTLAERDGQGFLNEGSIGFNTALKKIRQIIQPSIE